MRPPTVWELWAVGRYDLGLSEQEVWGLEPWQFGLLAERRRADERRKDLRAAMAAAATYNVHRKRGSRPIRPDDLIGREMRRQSPEALRRKAALITALLGGTIVDDRKAER